MSKLFSVVGVSRIRERDAMKLRVANGGAEARAKRLTRGGHVEVVLFDTEPMTKQAALDWLELNHPQLAAQIGSKQVKAVRAKVAKPVKVKATKKVAKPEVVEPVVSVEVVDTQLSPAAKLALKRARDAARKREKRAAEKAAKLAAAA